MLQNIILRLLSNGISFPIIKQAAGRKLIIVYYHLWSDENVPHIKNLYKFKNQSQFSTDLDFLLKNYKPLELKQVIDCLKNDRLLPPDSFLLTFDDGLREIYDVIAPLLLDKGVPATFFLSTSFIDNYNLGYNHKASLLVENIRKGISARLREDIRKILIGTSMQYNEISDRILKIDYSKKEILDRIAYMLGINFQEYLDQKKPYLTSSKIKALIDKGFTIGAHSIDHPYYSTLSLNEQVEQTILSARQIRETFELDYGAFAFPYNDAGVYPKFFTIIKESGLVDITFGKMLAKGLRSHMQRISLEKPIRPAKEIILREYLKLFRRKL